MRPRCFSFTQCGISFFTWKAVGSLYGILQLFYNFYQNICLLLLWIPFSFLLRFRKYLVPLIEGCFGISLSLAPWLTCVRFVDNLCHSLTVRVDFRFDNALALSSSKNFCITCFFGNLTHEVRWKAASQGNCKIVTQTCPLCLCMQSSWFYHINHFFQAWLSNLWLYVCENSQIVMQVDLGQI